MKTRRARPSAIGTGPTLARATSSAKAWTGAWLVPGIGLVPIGGGDLSRTLGYPRRDEHARVVSAMKRMAETWHKHEVIVGNPHVGAKNGGRLLGEGYHFLMSKPSRSCGVVGQGRARGLLT